MTFPNPQGADHDFLPLLYQWSARMSGIALEMVVPALIGIGLDRLCGTVVLFVLLGAALGMALGFWQLTKIAAEMAKNNSGVDKTPDTEDNDEISTGSSSVNSNGGRN